jgi:hypothetical protein
MKIVMAMASINENMCSNGSRNETNEENGNQLIMIM